VRGNKFITVTGARRQPVPACPKYVRLFAGIGSPWPCGGRHARQNRIWVGVEEEEKRNKLTLCVCSIFHVYGFLIQFIEFLFSFFFLISLSDHSGTDEAWEAVRPQGCSPLLVFVNSKSGDNQGVKFLRRFKQLLNPAQVFDLMNGGPGLG
jgi:hypothetical protein